MFFLSPRYWRCRRDPKVAVADLDDAADGVSLSDLSKSFGAGVCSRGARVEAVKGVSLQMRSDEILYVPWAQPGDWAKT